MTGIGIGFNVDDQGAVSGYYDTYSLNRPTWRYYHDGQAPIEDDKTHDPGTGTRKDVTRYALGARGGDMVETVLSMGLAGEQTVRSYPLYDGHGSMVGQVARAEDEAPGGSFVSVLGAPQFELGARRKYDAWGQVRWTEGQPADQGYCASLQHRRDAESGLVYMRARYYEPWTGRFISEDPAMDGANWYVYCANDPVNETDSTGLSRDSVTAAMRQAFMHAMAGNWDSLVELMDVLVTAFGGPAIDGRARMIIDALNSVPTPKGGLKKLGRWRDYEGEMNQIILHIHKALTHHEYAIDKHLSNMKGWLEHLYKKNAK
ncbi:MAG: RHS repeat-associated core domain-containing protein [Fimbriimonadaceae bacterium]|nr:RHS repeat-associated core domain-containing protein [Fimbriimonadaceae bacterium]QYK58954.1 MAG: RHS repeat-associated core domain-containing protein [Fimbriimonadaceae bacterium]